MNIRAGTLDDTTWLVPLAHTFLKSAQPWVLPAANAECHDSARPISGRWRRNGAPCGRNFPAKISSAP